jgi:hypothetical protein
MIDAFIFAIGSIWCWQVIRRVRSDVDELRTAEDTAAKVAIIIIWLITLCIAAWILRFAYGTLWRIFDALRALSS